METKPAEFDFIVVGSGPGGGTVAKELSAKGKKVLILEWGNNAPIRGSLFQMVWNLGIPGKSLMISDQKLLGMVRGICTGGSSVYFCATAFDPPYDLFASYGIDLREEVADLKKELPIAPLQDHLVGPGSARMTESALDLGYNWQKLNKFIYQNKCKTDCFQCSYGCPYDAKWTARNYVQEATENGATLINGAKVNNIIFEANKAVGVTYHKNFKTHTALAKKIILSAGGVGSPTILRQSGLYDAGYDFFFDPLVMVFGTVDGLQSNGEVQMISGVHMEEDGFLMVDLNFPTPVFTAMNTLKLRPYKGFSRSKTLMLMIKIKDELGGRITWNGGVRKSLSRQDQIKLKKGCDHAARIMKKAGAKEVYTGWNIAAHPGGTVKINHLVDSNLKTERDNLYVCDCSVIPEAWGLPPTLTLLALGKRLAGHLA
jgi:choline dehydrogenase-like flavoprotein